VKKQNQDAGWFGNMFGNQQPQVKQEFRGKRENQHAQRIDPLIIQGLDGKFHAYKEKNNNPYARSSNGPTSNNGTSQNLGINKLVSVYQIYFYWITFKIKFLLLFVVDLTILAFFC